jgi:hypothetical protein
MPAFDQAQAIARYTELMEAGPLAENEEELQALIELAYAQGMYFDYDREKQSYILETKVEHYNRQMDERNRIIRESVEKPWLPLHDGE